MHWILPETLDTEKMLIQAMTNFFVFFAIVK